jgi:hypothetical protein
MAGLQALVRGGCGDGGAGGTSVTKFADGFLASQSLVSQWQHSEHPDIATIDPVHRQLLTDPDHPGGHAASLIAPGALLSPGFDPSDALENEFLASFHPAPPEPTVAIEANMAALHQALSSRQAFVPALPFQLPPTALTFEQKCEVVKQINHLLTSHQLPSQEMFDHFLGATIASFSIEQAVIDEVALEDEWVALQNQPAPAVQVRSEAELLQQEFANTWDQLAVHQAAETAALEQAYQEHFHPVAQTAAVWQQEFEDKHDMEEAYQEATAAQTAENWANEFQPPLTEEEQLRQEEAAWFAQFCVAAPPSTQAASWIDEFLQEPTPAGPAGPSSGISQFHQSVQQIANQIEAIPDGNFANSHFMQFLRDVGSGQIDVNAAATSGGEQTFFPS